MNRISYGTLVVLWAIALSPAADAATIPAASCLLSVVQAAINSAASGDTVTVPAGTCDWTGGVSISGIQLVGAGKSTVGTVITAGAVTITKHATHNTRLNGFRFTGTSRHVTIGGNSANKPFIVGNNYLFTNGGTEANKMIFITVNGGLLHHNEFVAGAGTGGEDVFNIGTSENWSQPATLGMADTNGDRNIYFENNSFTNILETMPDADVGSRIVIRYNTYTDSSIVFHSGSPNDTSPGGGNRHFEIYNNTFRRVSNSLPINKWVWVRGGSGVIANNVMDRADSPDGTSYGGKPEIRLTVGCPSAYPVQYQVGQTSATQENPPSKPLAIFGNTGAGATDANFISVQSGVIACANPASYVQQGRDYVLSNTWGWTPYTYPHPLASQTTPAPPDTTAPSTPTNPSAAAMSSSQIDLSWTAATDNVAVTGYRVDRCVGSTCSNFAQIATPSGSSFSDTGLTSSTAYRYRVGARDAAGNWSGYSSIASATTQSGGGPPPLPSGNNGISALYPGDTNIRSHPGVIFADDFESYSSVSQLSNNWNSVYQQQYTRIATEPGNVFSGGRALEFRVPQQSSEVANAVIRNISPTEDTVFVRVYTKFEAGYNVIGSNHNGIAIKSQYCCPGVPANGTNKFYVDIENSHENSPPEPTPGYTKIYVYHPEQRSQWGDLWYPDGKVIPFDLTPGDFGPYFIPRPNFTPELNRWYSYELMVKANTPGQRDGRIAMWIDGNLIADFLNVRLRDVSSLKIDVVELGFHIGSNTIRQNLKWYDNAVIARSYIGPMSVAGPPLAPPTNISAIVQ